MNTEIAEDNRATLAAMGGAAVMIAQQIAGKATRDALFLSQFEVTVLPKMVVLAALTSILGVLAWGRLMRKRGPHPFVSIAFAVNGAAMVALGGLARTWPAQVAVANYLLVSVLGPVLISGFWSLINERYDPRTARRTISQLAAFGIFGGIAGGILADRVTAWAGVSALLPVMGAMHFVCAALVFGIRPTLEAEDRDEPPFHGLRVLGQTTYLRSLALLIVLGAIGAALLDYAFKARIAESAQSEQALMRVFAAFHTVVALVAFGLQVGTSRQVLHRLGVARTVATLPLSMLAGSGIALAIPGAASGFAARAIENVARNSLFRSGYEMLFTPIPPRERRSTKALIDVGSERVGDALGGALAAALLGLSAVDAAHAMLWITAGLGVAGAIVAFRLHKGYVATLASSLEAGAQDETMIASIEALTPTLVLATARADGPAIGLAPAGRTAADPSPQSPAPVDDSKAPIRPGMSELLTQRIDLSALRKVIMRDAPTDETTEDSPEVASVRKTLDAVVAARNAPAPSGPMAAAAPTAPEVARLAEETLLVARRIEKLMSGEAEPIREALGAGILDPTLVPLAIAALGRDDVATDALIALKPAAARHAGQLGDALVDTSSPPALRRRVARLLGVSRSRRAIQALVEGLEDASFDVRYACGVSLARIRSADESIAFDEVRIYAVVRREVEVERAVWQSRHEIERLEESNPLFAGAYLRARASASLEHVFNLLSFVLPHRPLQIALRGLAGTDRMMRGMALEYLDSVLPNDVRDKLWPYLEPEGKPPEQRRTLEEILSDLMTSHESIRIKLSELGEEMKQSMAPKPDEPPAGGKPAG